MDHDLRYDAAELPTRGYSAVDDWVLRQRAARLNPADLRTVPMPVLRTPQAHAHDTRTFDEQVTAELVRIVDVLQVVVLRLDLIEETLRGIVTHE